MEAILELLTKGRELTYFTAACRLEIAPWGLSITDLISCLAWFGSLVDCPSNRSTANTTYPACLARVRAIFFMLSFNPQYSWIIITAGSFLPAVAVLEVIAETEGYTK